MASFRAAPQSPVARKFSIPHANLPNPPNPAARWCSCNAAIPSTPACFRRRLPPPLPARRLLRPSSAPSTPSKQRRRSSPTLAARSSSSSPPPRTHPASRALLCVPALQLALLSFLLEKLPEHFDGAVLDGLPLQDDVGRLIVAHFRWLDFLVDADASVEKPVEVLSVALPRLKKEILEIVGHHSHAAVVSTPEKLLQEDSEAVVAMLDALSDLNLNKMLQEQIRDQLKFVGVVDLWAVRIKKPKGKASASSNDGPIFDMLRIRHHKPSSVKVGPGLQSIGVNASKAKAPEKLYQHRYNQDSFELPWRDSSRDGDNEMGMHQAYEESTVAMAPKQAPAHRNCDTRSAKLHHVPGLPTTSFILAGEELISRRTTKLT
ncbi:hypothetical protein EJB05_15061, partial [Eragrostis curvula]